MQSNVNQNNQENDLNIKGHSTLSSLRALSPLLMFFSIFIGSGIYFTLIGKEFAFYQVSASVAILPAIILAIFLAKAPLQKALNVFLEGARDNNIIIMCLIYLLAGAFATVLQNIGGVTSTVNLALSFVPAKAALPALFIIAGLVSTAMGTSMGTIAAVAPIGVGIANSIGIPLPLTMGAVVGGAMFGDNLSMISDTTIAATQIHGCSNLAKFKQTLVIALPALVVTLGILTWYALTNEAEPTLVVGEYKVLSCLPYLVVLAMALWGVNVFVVLTTGIVAAGLIGIFSLPSYNLVSFSQNIFDGYKSMAEILILSVLMGGLGELIKHQGGFSLLTRLLDRFLHKDKINTKAAEGAISTLVSFSDICTANNTTAIILSAEVTKEIAKKHKVSPARAATLVDLFACVFQGLLPYSAQILMAGSLAAISPLSIIPEVHYCILLGISGTIAIMFQLPRLTIKREKIIEAN